MYRIIASSNERSILEEINKNSFCKLNFRQYFIERIPFDLDNADIDETKNGKLRRYKIVSYLKKIILYMDNRIVQSLEKSLIVNRAELKL